MKTPDPFEVITSETQPVFNMDGSPRFSAKEMDQAIADCKRFHLHNVEMDNDGYCSACGYLDPLGGEQR